MLGPAESFRGHALGRGDQSPNPGRNKVAREIGRYARPTPGTSGGKLPIAFVLGKDAEVLDFCGPLEVFANAATKDGQELFTPYMVAATLDTVTVGGRMKVVPDHTYKTAPAPKLIVTPAMNMDGAPPEMYEWIRAASKAFAWR